MLRTARNLIVAHVYMAAAICWLAIPVNFSLAVVIDDFQVGAITVVGPSVQTQTGLDPSHVLGGSREMNIGQFGAGSVLEIDPNIGLKFHSTSNGYFDLKYNFTSAGPGIDLTQGSADRIRLVFGDISTSNFTPLSLYVSLPPNSSSNGVSLYLGSWDDLILEYPFSTFPVSMCSVQSVTLSIWRNFPGASLVVESITTAAQPLAGDYNRDGMVDSADYSVWRRFAGINTRTNSIFPIASADGNADGRVDSADYIIWRKSVASGSGAGFGVADLVPEPSPLYPALCALILARDPRVRRRGD